MDFLVYLSTRCRIVFKLDIQKKIKRKKQACIYTERASQVVLVAKNPPANAGDSRGAGSISGSGRSPGVANGNLLQLSCLKNSMDKRVWQATVHGAAKSQIRLSTYA